MSGDFRPCGIVSLTTDFGGSDGYVGAMKGVMLGLDRRLTLVDVAHDVEAQGVVRGAMTLHASAPWFPAGTVHLGVVDPGVGTARAPIVVLAGGHAFVGPDNGLFAPVAAALGGVEGAWRIDRHPTVSARISSTFHGRDVFAPTAAGLASGAWAPDEVGPVVEPLELAIPRPEREAGGQVRGRVLFTDHFGNLVTNVDEALLHALGGGEVRVRVEGGAEVTLCGTYGEVATGELLAVVGSEGRLEISVRDGSAARRLGLGAGAEVVVTPRA